MKSKNIILGGLTVVCLVCGAFGYKIASSKSSAPTRKLISTPPPHESVEEVAAQVETKAEKPATTTQASNVPAELPGKPLETGPIEKSTVTAAVNAEVEILRQSVVTKTLEIEKMQAALDAKDKELVLARGWKNTRDEVIAAQRLEIKALKEQAEKNAAENATRNEAIAGVKSRTFKINP